MKTLKKNDSFKLVSFKSLLILFFTLSSSASFAQAIFASNDKPGSGNTGLPAVPGSNVHAVAVPASSISTAPAVAPASAEELATTGEVNIAGNVVENHLLILEVRTQKRNLTTALYDENGNRLTYENFIDAGSYRMIDHTRNLKPGSYYLYVMESGKVIEKEKFEIR